MYRTSAAIESTNQTLAAWFPSFIDRLVLDSSHEGRTISALRIRAGRAEDRHAVVLVGGTHARELLNPDLLVELVIKLIVSYKNDEDIVLGDRVWGHRGIRTMMEALDILVLPNANPDGRERVLGGDRLWRKNRASLSGTSCLGVDLNRNFDLLWGIETYHPIYGKQTSVYPCSDTYVGPGAFSEPESRNVKRLLDDHDVHCLVDVHSYSEWIIHPWGHALNQTGDASQRFPLVDTSGWSLLPNDAPDYKEYIPPRDLERFQKVGAAAAEAIHDVRGRTYLVKPGTDLYPTTGTMSDYAYGRHVADPALGKTYGFTFETGPYTGVAEESFQPPFPEAERIMEEAMSGLLSVLNSCVCAIHLIGVDLFGDGEEDTLAAMREFRDERMTSTPAGRSWVDLVNRHQAELAALATRDTAFKHVAGELLAVGGEILRSGTVDRDRLDELRRLLTELAGCAVSPQLEGDLRRLRLLLRQADGRSLRQALSLVLETAVDEPPPRRRRDQAD